jgi:hypothetical protein
MHRGNTGIQANGITVEVITADLINTITASTTNMKDVGITADVEDIK